VDPTVDGPDAQTLTDVLGWFADRGYSGQLRVVDPVDGVPTVECLTCHQTSPADELGFDALRRLEGVSDPEEMVAVVGLDCPHCGTSGTLVVQYGPGMTAEEAGVLAALPDDRQGAGF
jgi:hypothetical protein